ncbi:MAG: 50S ribosomal protein L9 [Chitinophagaceae bacterium]
MNVILLKDIDTLGLAYEVVKVKDGYARNYLIPQNIAIYATDINLKKLGERLRAQQKQEELLLAKIQEVIEKLKENAIKIPIKTGTSGKIFGSVTTIQVARCIKKQTGFEIDRKKIRLPEMLTIGTYTAQIDFSNQHIATLTLDISAEK